MLKDTMGTIIKSNLWPYTHAGCRPPWSSVYSALILPGCHCYATPRQPPCSPVPSGSGHPPSGYDHPRWYAWLGQLPHSGSWTWCRCRLPLLHVCVWGRGGGTECIKCNVYSCTPGISHYLLQWSTLGWLGVPWQDYLGSLTWQVSFLYVEVHLEAQNMRSTMWWSVKLKTDFEF